MSNFFETQKSKTVPSTIDLGGGGKGGGERIKPQLEVIICIFEPWAETLRRSNIIQKQAPTARQTPDASPPTPLQGQVNDPPPCPLKV